MKFRFGFIITFIFTCVLSTQAQPPLKLTVLSYNIHHAEGVDGKLDVERIANIIKSVTPDLVALQEVDRKTKRVKNMDQPMELSLQTGMDIVFGKTIDYQGGEYGIAVLSRLPIDAYEVYPLPSPVQREPRALLELKLNLPEGYPSPLYFYCTHLDHVREDVNRIAAVNHISEIVQKIGDAPALLAGDINDVRGSTTLDLLTQDWEIAGEEMYTIPVGKPQRQIDFIFSRPEGRWRVVDVRVLDEKTASDHRPILAELEFLPSESSR